MIVPNNYRAESIENRKMIDADVPLTFMVMPADCNPKYARDEFKCALATGVKKVPGVIAAQVKRTRTYLLYEDGTIVRYRTASVIQSAFDRDIIKVPEEGIEVTIKPIHKSGRFESRSYKRSLYRARKRARKRSETKTTVIKKTKKKKQYRTGDLELSLRHGGSTCAFLRE